MPQRQEGVGIDWPWRTSRDRDQEAKLRGWQITASGAVCARKDHS